MPADAPARSTPPVPPKPPGFWQRRIVEPVIFLLKQGVTPDRLAVTLAVGAACSLFPLFGFTTLLNIGVGLRLRLNQPILQAINYLLSPIHLLLIPIFVRIGEKFWGAPPLPFSVAELVATFHDASLAEFLQRFGWAGVHAVTAWLLFVPVILAGLYFPLRPVMRKLAGRRAPAA